MPQQFYTYYIDIYFVSHTKCCRQIVYFDVCFVLIIMIPGKMASKENTSSASDNQQQPVVDRDKVKNEREARRMAKLASKQKVQDKSRNLPNTDEKKTEEKVDTKVASKPIKSPKVDSVASDQNTHRKTQKHGKADEKKESISVETIANDLEKVKINNETSHPPSGSATEKPEKKQLSKAERRAIQEAQRAAKATKATEKSVPKIMKKENQEPKAGSSTGTKPKHHENTPSTSKEASARKSTATMPIKKSQQHRVKLFSHLYTDISPDNLLSSNTIHPAIVRLGVQYSSGIVKGCNARGLAFMSAIKEVIAEYETPSQKEFSRSLEDVIKKCGNYLQQCRPLAVSVTNAMKFIQFHLRQLPKSENDTKVCDFDYFMKLLIF